MTAIDAVGTGVTWLSPGPFGVLTRGMSVLPLGTELRAMPTADRTRAHVFVSGTVQGVYFRANTRDTARHKPVDGWVRNLDDGRVEAVFEGSTDAVEEMVEWCHTGSPAARVEDVAVEYEDPEGLEGFSIRR